MPVLSGTARSRATAWGGSRAIGGSFAGKAGSQPGPVAVLDRDTLLIDTPCRDVFIRDTLDRDTLIKDTPGRDTFIL